MFENRPTGILTFKTAKSLPALKKNLSRFKSEIFSNIQFKMSNEKIVLDENVLAVFVAPVDSNKYLAF